MPATVLPLPLRPARRRRRRLLAAAAALLPCLLAPPLPALDPPTGRVWYVDNTAAEGGDGSLVAPFHRLSRAERASDTGDTIYVFRGDGTSTGLDRGIRLKPYQRLIGSGAAFAPEGEAPLPAGDPPLLTAASGAVVTLASHARLAGVHLRAGAGPALAAQQAQDLVVDAVRIDGGGVAAETVVFGGVAGARLAHVAIVGARDVALRLTRTSAVVLQHVAISASGDSADDAGLLITDPQGRHEMTGLEVAVRDGRGLVVEASAGSSELAIEGATLSGDPAAETATTAVSLTARGAAVLAVRLGSAIVQAARRRGVEVRALDTSRLTLLVTGSGFVGPVQSLEGVAAHASEAAQLDLTLDGNDVVASDAGVLVTAAGDSRLRLTLVDNVLPAASRGRGVALVLADRAEVRATLARNELAGQRAEAIFVRAGASSQLVAELTDNVVADASATSSEPLPSILLEAREHGRACVTLANNRVGEGPGRGPALLARQLDASRLTLVGQATAGGASQLAADSGLGRVEVEGGRLTAGDAAPCLAPPAAPAAATAGDAPVTGGAGGSS